MTQQIFSHRFPNGLTLVAEAMPWLESAAFALLVPCGCAYEPADRIGLASFTCEMMQRGSGSRDSRQFVEDLENLGLEGSAGVSIAHTRYGGAMPAVNLFEVLSIYADLMLQPHFAEDEFDDARQVCLQEVRSVEDELSRKMMQELRRRHYAEPWGRAHQGTEASIEAITPAEIVRFHQELCQPQGAILSVAGKIDWPTLRDHVEKIFSDWQPRSVPQIQEQTPLRGYVHLPHESGETHIGVAFDGLSYSHPDYFQLSGAIGVLSDGMSSRLFTEVREKRGLVYSVSASCHTLIDRGAVFAYAGTTTDKAQETLDVLLAELRKLPLGVLEEELARLKAHIKTSMIMQQESSRSRAGSIASDWYYLGRVRPMEELQSILNDLTYSTINAYLRVNPPQNFTICTLGEKSLEASHEIL